MFIIEGKQGKSRILEETVRKLPKRDCIVIDKVGIPSDWNESIYIFDFKEVKHATITSWLLSSLGKYITNEKTLVLELNCSKDELEDYLEIESKLIDYYGFERIMITVQNNEMEEILQYSKSE